jgi:hypothetical protein
MQSTTLLYWTRKNRGCWAFAQHDEVETARVIAKFAWYQIFRLMDWRRERYREQMVSGCCETRLAG